MKESAYKKRKLHTVDYLLRLNKLVYGNKKLVYILSRKRATEIEKHCFAQSTTCKLDREHIHKWKLLGLIWRIFFLCSCCCNCCLFDFLPFIWSFCFFCSTRYDFYDHSDSHKNILKIVSQKNMRHKYEIWAHLR